MEAQRDEFKVIYDRIQALENRMIEDLKKKKDTAVLDVELETLRRPHVCVQESRLATLSQSISVIEYGIHEIRKSLNRERIVKFSSVLALLLAIVSGTVYVVQASARTDYVGETVQKIEADVSQLKYSNSRVEKQLVRLKEKTEVKEDRDLKTFRKILKEQFVEVKALFKGKKRSR
jgi:hypothetical protein